MIRLEIKKFVDKFELWAHCKDKMWPGRTKKKEGMTPVETAAVGEEQKFTAQKMVRCFLKPQDLKEIRRDPCPKMKSKRLRKKKKGSTHHSYLGKN